MSVHTDATQSPSSGRIGVPMDIAALSTAMATSAIQTEVSTRVLSNALDMNETLGAGIVRSIDAAAMELSVNPHLGANVDMRI